MKEDVKTFFLIECLEFMVYPFAILVLQCLLGVSLLGSNLRSICSISRLHLIETYIVCFYIHEDTHILRRFNILCIEVQYSCKILNVKVKSPIEWYVSEHLFSKKSSMQPNCMLGSTDFFFFIIVESNCYNVVRNNKMNEMGFNVNNLFCIFEQCKVNEHLSSCWKV